MKKLTKCQLTRLVNGTLPFIVNSILILFLIGLFASCQNNTFQRKNKNQEDNINLGEDLLSRPSVAKVKVRVTSGVVDDLMDDQSTVINFEGVSGITSTEWSSYESVILKFGNQSKPSDWYVVYDKNNPVTGTTGPTYEPSPSSFDSIMYVHNGLIQKFQNALESGVTQVPLRLQPSGNPLPSPIFINVDFCYAPNATFTCN